MEKVKNATSHSGHRSGDVSGSLCMIYYMFGSITPSNPFLPSPLPSLKNWIPIIVSLYITIDYKVIYRWK